MYFRGRTICIQKCASRLVAHWSGACFCFMIFTAKLRKDLRPPLPCATSWLHTAQCSGDSSFQSFLLRNTSRGCDVGKTCNFVLHFDTLLDIRSLSNFFKEFFDPLFLNFRKNIRLLSLKNLIFRLFGRFSVKNRSSKA